MAVMTCRQEPPAHGPAVQLIGCIVQHYAAMVITEQDEEILPFGSQYDTVPF